MRFKEVGIKNLRGYTENQFAKQAAFSVFVELNWITVSAVKEPFA